MKRVAKALRIALILFWWVCMRLANTADNNGDMWRVVVILALAVAAVLVYVWLLDRFETKDNNNV